MKKLPILQVLLAVILVWVIALGFFFSSKKQNVTKIPENTGTSSLSDAETARSSLYEEEQKQLQQKMDSYNIYNDAVAALDISLCEKIVSNDVLKSECSDNVYSAKASKEKNVQLCEKIQDKKTQSRCANAFIYDSALLSWKQSDCDKITSDDDLKVACTKNIVFAKIENQSFSGTIDTCATLAGADKDYCINRIKKDSDIDLLQKGTNTKDINSCNAIKDQTMKTTCSDTVYMTTALEKKDGALCSKIIDPTRKTTCLSQFVKVADAWFLQQAIAGNNSALCEKITTSDMKVKCNDTLLMKKGVTEKSTTTCDKIIDISTKKQCNDAVKLILNQTSGQK